MQRISPVYIDFGDGRETFRPIYTISELICGVISPEVNGRKEGHHGKNRSNYRFFRLRKNNIY